MLGDENGPDKVLVVEDSVPAAHLVRALLQEAWPQVTVTLQHSLADTLAFLEQQAVDIVLSDLQLPDAEGAGTVEALVCAAPDTPVVVLSGRDDHEAVATALRLGALDFLVKGEVGGADLCAAVREAMALKQQAVMGDYAHWVVQTGLDGFLACDLSGRLLVVNETLTHILGHDRETLLGLSVTDLEAERSAKEVADHINRLLDRGGDRFETRLRHRDGHVVEVEVSAHYRSRGHGAIVALVRDVTTRNRLQRTLSDREQRLAAILGSVADAVISINELGIIQSFNPAAERMFGWSAAEIIGRNVTLFMPRPHANRHDDYIRHYLETGEPRIIGTGRELVGVRRDGSTFPMELTVTEARLESPRLFIGLVRDVSERKAMEAELRRLATTDGLTGVCNRRRYMELLTEEVERAVRYGHSLSVVMLDIDHFKRLNDTYGHAAGDAALKVFATRIGERLRRLDTVGRLGGEEFALILPDTTLADAVTLVEALRANQEAAEQDFEGEVLRFTMSVGVSSLTADCATADHLLAAADKALYQAKNGGRNRVVVAEPPTGAQNPSGE